MIWNKYFSFAYFSFCSAGSIAASSTNNWAQSRLILGRISLSHLQIRLV